MLSEERYEPTELEAQLELYEKGRHLRVVTTHPGWQTVLQVLRDYRNTAVQALVDLPPGDPTVPTVHAAASALDDQFVKFQQDINSAIYAVEHPTDEVIQALNGVRRALDVTGTMERMWA